MSCEPRIPDFLPTPLAGVPARLPEMALELYRRMAAAEQALAAERRRSGEEIEHFRRGASRLLARLAAARFEFDRLLRRLLPELATAERSDLGEVLALFARSWDAELQRGQVEVRDLAGSPLTDELAEVIEVEAAVPEPDALQAMVRETLSPLVLWEGRVVGCARVITSVPVAVAAVGSLNSHEEES